jgi:hypothetical protein
MTATSSHAVDELTAGPFLAIIGTQDGALHCPVKEIVEGGATSFPRQAKRPEFPQSALE